MTVPAAIRMPQAEEAPPALELYGIVRRYGRNLVLRDVNLVVTAGRTLALTGHNGAGKTTLLRLLATRLRPTRGEGRVFGYDLIRDAAHVRRRVALLSSSGGSYLALSARENLKLAATLYGRRGVPLDDLLERVGLSSAGDKLVRTFSSGMKKRLALARLILADADLWLLDEPYAALDAGGRALVDELLRDSRHEGRTVLLASHELDRVLPLADRVVELAEGRVQPLQGAAVVTVGKVRKR